jgi:hypothetical protein
MSMQSKEPVNTIIFVSGRKTEAIIEQDLQRRGLRVEWANSIKAAKDLLTTASEQLPSSRTSPWRMAGGRIWSTK